MSYKPSDSYYGEFTTQNFNTGVATDADSLPVATATQNGTDDAAFVLTVTNMDTGRYKVTGTVPASYSDGDSVQISVAATVSTVSGKAIIDSFVIQSKRASDIVTDIFAHTPTIGGVVTFEDVIKAVYGMARGKITRDSNAFTFYDDDNTTELYTLTINDSNTRTPN